MLESTSLEMDSALKMENSEMLDQYLITKKVKDDYNNYIKDKRMVREKKKRVVISTKIRGNALSMSVEEIEADPDIGLDDFNIGYQEPQFQTEQFALSVVKPIGKYEPMQIVAISKQNFEFDENKIIKKKDKPDLTTQAEIRDCNEELDGSKLQKIFAGPQSIDFKNVFVKSTTTKEFTVRNNLRQLINVTLVIKHQELSQSFLYRK